MANPSGPPTAFDSLLVGGVPTMGSSGIPLTTGNVYFVNPSTGNDGNVGTAQAPLATLYQGYAKCVAGNGDVVVLVGNGAASGSARLSTALAQTINPSATTGTLTWAKNNTHLVGIGSPTMISQRARIAPPTGTYTQATFGSGNFIVVTATGCIFSNFSVFNGFSTGGTNQIAWTDSGGRNYYNNVDFEGMGDAASAADTGSRSVLITGTTGENTFVGCNFGLDTVQRSVANASLEFAGGTPRNTFIDCMFPFWTSASSPLGILATGASAIDRWQQFKRCQFVNAVSSGSTTMSVLASMTNAAPGGLLNFDPECSITGITKWGDTNALANSWVAAPSPTAATTGRGVNPS